MPGRAPRAAQARAPPPMSVTRSVESELVQCRDEDGDARRGRDALRESPRSRRRTAHLEGAHRPVPEHGARAADLGANILGGAHARPIHPSGMSTPSSSRRLGSASLDGSPEHEGPAAARAGTSCRPACGQRAGGPLDVQRLAERVADGVARAARNGEGIAADEDRVGDGRGSGRSPRSCPRPWPRRGPPRAAWRGPRSAGSRLDLVLPGAHPPPLGAQLLAAASRGAGRPKASLSVEPQQALPGARASSGVVLGLHPS